ncbi:hypothetical protein Airi02_032520 [Actinoallomurus iriomotensis]|uniref:ADP ribosyltransferase domain-containing protein n=2 Tax=Actinoallomurus iriomotensis TaxID=478107 RepID=A0A9W6S143_9ACTN|nr:hypothetical protein Airi02_032520 [Actinoallomurus iriomotensis]
MIHLFWSRPEADEPVSIRVARRLLLAFGVSALVGSVSWFASRPGGESFGTALVVATPGAASLALTRRLPRRRRRTWWWVLALAVLCGLWQLGRIFDGNALGLIGLTMVVWLAVAVTRRSARAYFGFTPPERTASGDSGSTWVDYLAILLVVSVLVTAVAAVTPGAVSSGIGRGVCRMTGGDDCGGRPPTATAPAATAPVTTTPDEPMHGGDAPAGAVPERTPQPSKPKKNCGFTCSISKVAGSAWDFTKDTVTGGAGAIWDMAKGTWTTVTDATCIAGLTCNTEEQRKKIDEYVDQWNKFKDNPVQFTRDIVMAAVAPCKDTFTGKDKGKSFGKCLIEVAGAVAAKKLPTIVKDAPKDVPGKPSIPDEKKPGEPAPKETAPGKTNPDGTATNPLDTPEIRQFYAGARRFSSSADGANYARSNLPGTADLTVNQRHLIEIYTDNSAKFTDPLRGTSSGFKAEDLESLYQKFDATMRPIKEDIVVTRSVNWDSIAPGHPEDGPRVLAQMEGAGLQTGDAAYMSTSVADAPIIFQDRPIVMHLRVPKGTPAVYTGDVSRYAHEQELILQRGRRYTVDQVVQDPATGQYHVYATIAPP